LGSAARPEKGGERQRKRVGESVHKKSLCKKGERQLQRLQNSLGSSNNTFRSLTKEIRLTGCGGRKREKGSRKTRILTKKKKGPSGAKSSFEERKRVQKDQIQEERSE